MCEYRYQIPIGIHQCRCCVHSEVETLSTSVVSTVKQRRCMSVVYVDGHIQLRQIGKDYNEKDNNY